MAVAGQLAVGDDGSTVGSTVEEQLPLVMGNLQKVLRSAGGSLQSVLKFTTYLVSVEDIPVFYETRAKLWPELFPDGTYPANTLLVVQSLVRPDFRIEVEALALV